MIDLFPANVTVASTTYHNVRAVIADGTLQLWRLGPSGPEVFHERSVTGAVDGAPTMGVNIPTADGIVWAELDGGCGCGSALKVADLYPGRQRVMTSIG